MCIYVQCCSQKNRDIASSVSLSLVPSIQTFDVDTERMSLSPISMFQFTLFLALHITYVQFLEVFCILHHFYKWPHELAPLIQKD